MDYRRMFLAIWLIASFLIGDLGYAQENTTRIFPQIATGSGVAVEFILTNPSLLSENGTILFKDQAGAPLPLVIEEVAQTSIPYSILPGRVLKLESSGEGDLKVGYAILVPENGESQVTATLVYNIGGLEVSVPTSGQSVQYHVFAEKNSLANSGIALVNPQDEAIEISVMLLGNSGEITGQTLLEFSPGQHVASFIDELFDIGESDFIGSLHARSDSPFVMLGLRQRPNGSLATLGTAPSAFPADIVVAGTNDPRFSVLAGHKNGEKLLFFSGGAVWIGPDGEEVTIFQREDGLPGRVVVGAHVLLFDNYGETTADVAVITPNGELGIERGLALDGATLASLRAVVASNNLNALAPNLAQDVEAIREAALLISLVSCQAAGPVAILPCTSAFVSGLAFFTPSETPTDLSLGLSEIGCGTGDFAACVALFLDGGASAAENAESELASNAETLNTAADRLRGELVIVNFEVTLTEVDDLADFFGVNAGDVITGVFQYQVPASDTDPRSEAGGYYALAPVELTIGSHRVQITPQTAEFAPLLIANDVTLSNGEVGDVFQAFVSPFRPGTSGVYLEGPNAGETFVPGLSWLLIDADLTLIKRDALIVLPGILSDWETTDFLFFPTTAGPFLIGEISSYEVTAVPSPQS